MSHTHRKKPFTTVQSCQPGEPCLLCQRRVGITVGKARERMNRMRDHETFTQADLDRLAKMAREMDPIIKPVRCQGCERDFYMYKMPAEAVKYAPNDPERFCQTCGVPFDENAL